MSERYEFTRVHRLTEDAAQGAWVFGTDAGQQVSVRHASLDDPTSQFLRRAVAEDKVIFVSYDPATGRCTFAAPFNVDHVDSIEPRKQLPPALQVQLMKRPSRLWLAEANPRFQALRTVLENAKSAGQAVWVGTFPGDTEILDVQLPAK